MRKVEDIERDWQTWDAQIESDGRAGKLDRLVSEALDDYQAGRAQPK